MYAWTEIRPGRLLHEMLHFGSAFNSYRLWALQTIPLLYLSSFVACEQMVARGLPFEGGMRSSLVENEVPRILPIAGMRWWESQSGSWVVSFWAVVACLCLPWSVRIGFGRPSKQADHSSDFSWVDLCVSSLQKGFFPLHKAAYDQSYERHWYLGPAH